MKKTTLIAVLSAVVALILVGVAVFMLGRMSGAASSSSPSSPASAAAPARVQSSTPQTSSRVINSHEYVDLGLSVLWATCNVGASSPGVTGNFYSWGETSPKGVYSHTNYSLGNAEQFYKYVPYNYPLYSMTYSPDGRLALEYQDDAASSNWGSPWRTPTKAEFEELNTRCSHQWTSRDGQSGMLFIGPNGNSIFLPAGGWCDAQGLKDSGSKGFYWSKSLKVESPNCAYRLYFDYDKVGASFWYGRFYGYMVRPVADR